MGSLFRSEEMQLSQLILHTDSAYMCIAELGELGVVQIRDANPEVNAFQRKFVDEVRRCDEMERKLRYIEGEIMKEGLTILEADDTPEAPPPREMIELESTLEKLENELREVNLSVSQLKQTFMELTEVKFVLRRAQVFFEEAPYEVNMTVQAPEVMMLEDPESAERKALRVGDFDLDTRTDEYEVLFRGGGTPSAYSRHVDFVAGVILRDRLLAFERMLWRACRGNVFLRHAEIESVEDPATGEPLNKCMFIIFFQGEQLKSRVEKICDGFHATLYPCPDTQEKRQAALLDVTGQREDLQVVLTRTNDHRDRVLQTASMSLRQWFVKVRKMKAIYHTLNLFNLDVTTKCMIGECWSAVSDLDVIRMALRRGMERSNSTLQPILNGLKTTENPPTFHRVNKFTAGYQNIVDAYGVANYREVNPALFTIITFPFLFAVMFGDAGHGLIMFLFGLWMVLCENKLEAKKIKDELWNTFFGGRYIILLMGAFSIYTGMIYNDIFSKSANIFGSRWHPRYDNKTLVLNPSLQLNPLPITNATGMFSGYPYPFGVDPVWQVSGNMIMFSNSLKMKMSIIIGVLHMLFGVSLGAFNHRFFNDPLAIYCEFIPQVLFLSCIFGYLSITIIYKWIAFDSTQASVAPSLLITLINMMRFSYEPTEILPLYPGQMYVQCILVVIALISIPWMLFSKPLILRHRNKISQRLQAIRTFGLSNSAAVLTMEEDDRHAAGDTSPIQKSHRSSAHETSHGDHGNTDEFNFGEVMVFQAIHTIEYCLGCISNTASYLRLWALSLAHAQLSEVLWDMVMINGLKVDGYFGCVILFFVFAAWACLTVGVLVIMEGLSAFLHAIRLHWVEFNNKFYVGAGYLFMPFYFQTILNQASE